jgi:hypothetical protein
MSAGPGARAEIIMNAGGWVASTINFGEATVFVYSVEQDVITIGIWTDFLDPPGPSGNLSSLDIDFLQIEEDAVPRIIIADEGITNFTGVDWTDFTWEILDSPDTWFNVSESAGLTVDPFTNKTFADFIGPNMAQTLRADGGVIPSSGATFFPGGSADPNDHLVIDATVGTLADPTSFTLRQFPTPEPASLALLALGGAVLLRRRVRS